MVSNEVFIGAGAGATMIPELELNLSDDASNADKKAIAYYQLDTNRNSTFFRVEVCNNFRNIFKLIPDLYTGCRAKVGANYYTVVTNDVDSLYFKENVADDITTGTSANINTTMSLLANGAPLPAPLISKTYDTTSTTTSSKLINVTDGTVYNVGDKLYSNTTLSTSIGEIESIDDNELTLVANASVAITSAALYVDEGKILAADNWLGLVNTITPPSVDVEMKQLNLAVSGTRNFAYQFKGAETLSGGSLDMSMNNGSWLYYALGKINSISGESVTSASNPTDAWNDDQIASDRTYMIVSDAGAEDIGGPFFHKVVKGSAALMPPLKGINTTAEELTLPTVVNGALTNGLTYTFDEANGEKLPSFSLEVAYEKGTVLDNQVDAKNPNENLFARVFTGMKVNSLTLNFEEGQEVKTTVDMMGRRGFDVPNKYITKNYRGTDNNTRLHTNLYNFGADEFNRPFQYFDGGIKIFGQQYARIKTGSVTINNNLAEHRFVGNYNRQTVSELIAGQRTYELSFTALVTDNTLWDELRGVTEHGSDSLIELDFRKDTGEQFVLKFKDYMVSALDVPFPDDKGPVEFNVTVMARSLDSATYTGHWIIQG